MIHYRDIKYKLILPGELYLTVVLGMHWLTELTELEMKHASIRLLST